MRMLAILLPLLAGACDLSMQEQAKRTAQGAPTLWPGGPPQAAMPDGTIDQAAPHRAAAFASPPALTPALLDRGEQRHAIFCAMCHGPRGEGDGTVVRRGFPRPPSYRDPHVLAETPAQLVQVITDGHGTMYGHGDRIPEGDRWAIAAYVKALQRLGPAEAAR